MNRNTHRAKTQTFNSWVYGGYYKLDDEDGGYRHFIQPTKGEAIEIDINTLCQSTGEIDAKGEVVFENDIVTSKSYPFQYEGGRNYDGVIEWVFEGFQIIYVSVGDNRGSSDGINIMIDGDMEHYEVIGNIIDNPNHDM